jgi:hypothetical protein
LSDITIPVSVTSIGEGAFGECGNLASISVASGNSYYQTVNGVLFDMAQTTLLCHPANANNTTYSMPDSVTSIGRYAFSNCSSLTSVTIPDSVTGIGENAFSGCSSLTSVTIPDYVTIIGDYAFSGCSRLSDITIPNLITEIGRGTFAGCTGLTSIVIPDAVTSISNYAFDRCSKLTSVTIPISVTSIDSCAFRYCTALTDVYYAGSEADWIKVQIGSYGNDPLTNATIHYGQESSDSTLDSGTCGENVTWTLDVNGTLTISGTGNMEDYVAPLSVPWYSYRSRISKVVITDGVTSIGSHAFYDCYSLTSVTIPDSVTSIGKDAFSWCSNLTSVTIPNSVISIGNSTFYCSGLISVTIPDSVTSIGDGAFSYCSSLTSVTISDSVTSIGDWAFEYCNLISVTIPDSVTSIGYGAFYECSNLTAISVDPNNRYYTSVDGVLFDATKTKLICHPAKSDRTSYEIPDSVTSIGIYAFCGCSSLTSVTIPDSVTSIGDSAFSDCSSLTSVTIPEAVTSIGDFAFRFCSSLTSVTIPDSVTSIGSSAFEYCSSLTSITIPDLVTNISFAVFENCSSLTSVTIPDSVTSIGSFAFEFCSSLTSVTIPKSVTSISWYAFAGCDSLTDVYYAGSEADWMKVQIDSSGNDPLTNATIHYNDNGASVPGDDVVLSLFTVQDTTTAQPIERAQVLIVGADDESQISLRLTSDENGQFTAALPDGLYSVQATASDYQLRNFNITVSESKHSFSVLMNSRDLLDIKTTVKEMTLAEIEAAGIDPNAAGNQHVYECTAVLDFIPITTICNEEGKVIQGEPVSVKNVTVYPVARDIYLIVHSEVSWLKEMFDVELLVTNTSMMETVEDCVASLELPNGLSLATMGADVDAQQTTVSLGNINPNGQQSAYWYLCGDEKGEYTLNGTVTGTRTYYADEGDVPESEEDFEIPFTTQTPITVLASDAMELVIEAERYATVGQPYHMRYTLKNNSSKTLYNVSLDVLGGAFFQKYSVKEVLTEIASSNYTLSGSFNDGYTLTTTAFEPGDELSGIFTITFAEGLEDVEFDEWMLKDAFTMTGSGSTARIPTTIKIVDTISEHHWDNGVVTKEATCTEDGVTLYTCTDQNCGETRTETIPALGHTVVMDEAVPATCTESGKTEGMHCSVCGEVFAAQGKTAPLGHDYQQTAEKAATCTEDGSKTYSCSRCDDAYTENVPALGHDYTTEVIAPTCTEQGYTLYTCSRCDDSHKDNYQNALGHAYTKEVIAPTCTEQGYTLNTCSRGDSTYKGDYTFALGHRWDEGKVTVEPTLESEGKKIYTCTVCGVSKTESMPKLQEQKVSFLDDSIVHTYGDFTSGYFQADNYSEGGGKLTYTSSNEQVATVDDEGKFTIHGAGETTITATAAAVQYSYVETTASYKLTIEKAQLTIKANDAFVVYGEEATNNGYTADGFVLNETEAVLKGDAAYTYENYTQYSNVGEYPIELTGLTADNYDIIFAPGTLTVEKTTDYTITWDEDLLTQRTGSVAPVIAIISPQDKTAELIVEYMVNDDWTTTVPQTKGVYDVRTSLIASENIVPKTENIYTEGKLTVKSANYIGTEDGSGKMPVDVEVDKNGAINLEVSDEDVKTVVDQAAQNGGKLTVNLTENNLGEEKKSDTVILPSNLIGALDEQSNIDTLSVKTEDIEISMDRNVLNTLNKEVDDESKLEVSIQTVDSDALNEKQKKAVNSISVDPIVLDLTMQVISQETTESGGTSEKKTSLHKLNGQVNVRVKYDLPEDTSVRKIVICYVSDDGSVTYLRADNYENGYLTFTTNHFSTFIIGLKTYELNIEDTTDTSKTVTLTNLTDDEMSLKLVVAGYEDSGRMIALKVVEQTIMQSNQLQQTIEWSEQQQPTKFVAFLLDKDTLAPLYQAEVIA